MENQTIPLPRFAAPIIGAGVGLFAGYRAMRRAHSDNLIYPLGGALMGAMAGSVIWLMDAPRTPDQPPPSTAGTVLAILAVFPGVLPFVGLLFGLPAFVVNRKVSGWPNRISRLGLGLC